MSLALLTGERRVIGVQLALAVRLESADILLEWLRDEVSDGTMLHVTEDGQWCCHIGEEDHGHVHKDVNYALFSACIDVLLYKEKMAVIGDMN